MLKKLTQEARDDPTACLLAGAGLMAGVYNYYVRPEVTAKRSWAAIAAFVVAHEVICGEGELLSEAYDRGLEKHKLALTLGTLMVTGHLLNAFGKYDPMSAGLKLLRG